MDDILSFRSHISPTDTYPILYPYPYSILKIFPRGYLNNNLHTKASIMELIYLYRWINFHKISPHLETTSSYISCNYPSTIVYFQSLPLYFKLWTNEKNVTLLPCLLTYDLGSLPITDIDCRKKQVNNKCIMLLQYPKVQTHRQSEKQVILITHLFSPHINQYPVVDNQVWLLW